MAETEPEIRRMAQEYADMEDYDHPDAPRVLAQIFLTGADAMVEVARLTAILQGVETWLTERSQPKWRTKYQNGASAECYSAEAAAWSDALAELQRLKAQS